MPTKRPLLLGALPNLLINPLGEKDLFVRTRSITLVAWKITEKSSKCKEFQAKQPNLSLCPGDQVQLQFLNWLRISELAVVVNNKLIQVVRL